MLDTGMTRSTMCDRWQNVIRLGSGEGCLEEKNREGDLGTALEQRKGAPGTAPKTEWGSDNQCWKCCPSSPLDCPGDNALPLSWCVTVCAHWPMHVERAGGQNYSSRSVCVRRKQAPIGWEDALISITLSALTFCL